MQNRPFESLGPMIESFAKVQLSRKYKVAVIIATAEGTLNAIPNYHADTFYKRLGLKKD